jgi:TolB-like protein/DNA-binding winged helix-turn-helix (wHTH) protein
MDEPSAAKQEAPHGRLRLAGYTLDLESRELLSPELEVAPLRRQSLKVLLLLGSRAGQVVSREELLQQVWPNVVVGDNSLVQAVADIRRLLGDTEHKIVRNVSRRGYMLVPESGPDPTAQRGARGAGRLGLAVAAALLAAVVGGWYGVTHLRSGGPGPPLSVVVLPLANEGSADQAWFADALTNDIATELSRLPGSSVIGRDTAVNYRDRGLDPRRVAQELKVRYVLAGSVERREDDVRLRVRLVDGETGVHRWEDRIDAPRAALAGLVDDLAARLAQAVNLQMVRGDAEAAARLPVERVKADDLAMQGFGLLYTRVNPENNRLAADLFDRAVALDAQSARAWAGVAACAMNQARYMSPQEAPSVRARLRQAVGQLERLDSEGISTLSGRAFLRLGDKDAAGALSAADRLVERYPGHQAGYMLRGLILLRMGRFEEALAATERSLALLPQDPDLANKWRRSFILYALGRYADAAELAREVTAVVPDSPLGNATLVAALVRDGKRDEARRLLAVHLQRDPKFSFPRSALEGSNERFIAAREDLIAALRDAGLE